MAGTLCLLSILKEIPADLAVSGISFFCNAMDAIHGGGARIVMICLNVWISVVFGWTGRLLIVNSILSNRCKRISARLSLSHCRSRSHSRSRASWATSTVGLRLAGS